MSADDHGPGAGPSNVMMQALEPYLDAFADRVAERLEARRGRMVNQAESQLGRRRHRDAVTRRLANDEGGAGISGRNFLLTPQAVREELARGSGRNRGRSKGGPCGAPVPSAGGDGSPSSGAAATPPKSRARDLGDFEKDLMSGLHAVAKGRR